MYGYYLKKEKNKKGINMDPISMICPPGTACPLTALGLPEILLWVLTFAVVFAILTKLKIFSRAPAALVSIAIGFLVLMAMPATLIAVIASMSTGLIAVAIGILVIMALLEIAGSKAIIGQDEKGKLITEHHFVVHGTLVAIVLVVITAIIFWMSGGAALLGITALPMLSGGTILLILVGVAVLWMLSESPKPK